MNLRRAMHNYQHSARGAAALVVVACLLAGGCEGWEKPEPDPEHLKAVNKLFDDRYTAALDTMQLLKADVHEPVDGPSGTLTPDDAIQRALTHNLALVGAAESLPIAQANLVQAGLFENPAIGQSGAFYFPLFGAAGGATAFDVEIQQVINGFFTQPNKVAVAKAQRFQAGIDLSNQAFGLAQQTQTQYQQLVYLTRDGALQRKIADTYKKALDAAKAEVKVGLVTHSDYNRALIQYEDALRQAHHYDTQYEGAARQMNWLMGVQTAPQWQLPDSIKETPKVIAALPNQQRLEELGEKYRLDLLRASFDRKIADVSVELAKQGLFPQTTIGFDAARDSTKHWTGGPNFNIVLPIFDPGIVALWNVKYQREQTERNYVALQGQVRQDVRSALNALQIAAEDVIFLRDRTIPQEEENIKLAELSFKLGNSDLDDLLNSIREYVGVLQNYEDAIQAYNQAVIGLETAVGLAFPRIEQEAAGSPSKATTGAVVPGQIKPIGDATGPATLPGPAPHKPFRLSPETEPTTQPGGPPRVPFRLEDDVPPATQPASQPETLSPTTRPASP